MEIKFQIPDEKVCNFTDGAKSRLKEQSQEYTLEIISEAERVEKIIRENGASTEITDNIVFQAIRRNKIGKKKKIKFIAFRVFAELFLFISGLMFLPDKFITAEKTLNLTYFVIYIVITLSAWITTIITYFMGGD